MVTLGQIMSDHKKETITLTKYFICSTKQVPHLTSGLCYKRTTDVIYQLCAWTNVCNKDKKYPQNFSVVKEKSMQEYVFMVICLSVWANDRTYGKILRF